MLLIKKLGDGLINCNWTTLRQLKLLKSKKEEKNAKKEENVCSVIKNRCIFAALFKVEFFWHHEAINLDFIKYWFRAIWWGWKKYFIFFEKKFGGLKIRCNFAALFETEK